jgi:negative regulator of flagellin synthesis FlgM
MEIDGKNTPAGLNPGVQRLDLQTAQTHRTAKPGEAGASPGSDRIELSVRSREIQHVDELISSTPDIREAKVEQIRSAVESGTYNVKAEKIADKILGGSVIDQIF